MERSTHFAMEIPWKTNSFFDLNIIEPHQIPLFPSPNDFHHIAPLHLEPPALGSQGRDILCGPQFWVLPIYVLYLSL